jgi:hypothetical protein
MLDISVILITTVNIFVLMVLLMHYNNNNTSTFIEGGPKGKYSKSYSVANFKNMSRLMWNIL